MYGGRSIQINGEGFQGSAQDHSIYFKKSIALPGPAMTFAENFQSDIARGIIYYEVPSLSTLVGEADAQKTTYYDPIVSLLGPLKTDGTRAVYNCASSSDCKVIYDISYTPQVNRIYPSTVYSGQDLCFDVYTGPVSNSGRNVLKEDYCKLGDYSIELNTYADENAEAVSTGGYYQL